MSLMSSHDWSTTVFEIPAGTLVRIERDGPCIRLDPDQVNTWILHDITRAPKPALLTQPRSFWGPVNATSWDFSLPADSANFWCITSAYPDHLHVPIPGQQVLHLEIPAASSAFLGRFLTLGAWRA